MAFEDVFRISSHAVFTDDAQRVLLLRRSYADGGWGLPGGALEPGETVIEAVVRECREELDCEIDVLYLSGIYYHAAYNSHAVIFRCRLRSGQRIRLNHEHVEWRYFGLQELTPVQHRRVMDCLNFDGTPCAARF